jgi:hypothetical protein
MTTPADTPIRVGVVHRTTTEVEVVVYDYDALRTLNVPLRPGFIFQPWEPEPQWRGEKVPITLGRDHLKFDWCDPALEGHFLHWEDFFTKCEPER